MVQKFSIPLDLMLPWFDATEIPQPAWRDAAEILKPFFEMIYIAD